MKRIILTTLLLLLLVGGATAQVQQGTIVINGHIGYRNATIKIDKPDNFDNINITSYFRKSKEHQLYMAPRVGYLISENLETGLTFGYGSSRYENRIIYNLHDIEKEATFRSTSSSYSISPYLQKYLFISDKFAFLGIANLTYGKSISTSEGQGFVYKDNYQDYDLVNQSSQSSYHYYSGALVPGIALFVSERVNLRATLGALQYTRNKFKSDGSTTNMDSKFFAFSVSPQYFSFGLSYLVGR